MIDDVIQLSNDARVVAAYVQQPGHGVVLARAGTDWIVWSIFRPKKGVKWLCRKGERFKLKFDAECYFADRVDDMLPQISCPECGYYFTDQEEGCDACVGKKINPPTTVRPS